MPRFSERIFEMAASVTANQDGFLSGNTLKVKTFDVVLGAGDTSFSVGVPFAFVDFASVTCVTDANKCAYATISDNTVSFSGLTASKTYKLLVIGR